MNDVDEVGDRRQGKDSGSENNLSDLGKYSAENVLIPTRYREVSKHVTLREKTSRNLLNDRRMSQNFLKQRTETK